MSFMLKNEGHPDIKLSEEEAAYMLKKNGIRASRLNAIRSFNESAKLPKGAVICWSNNAGK
ncbi:hypothetical protein [Maridesulfovibrio sp.]|uniref:hypothetical protein n=1 Tax=Maridesulfovibrio sp. TaxID=2795000 RepID=UPI002AA836AB|nr:hypothetical protein [Maridesulfovibrio sp.]